MIRRATLLFLFRALLAVAAPLVLAGPALAAQVCTADVNADGDTDDVGESGQCSLMDGGGYQCPIRAVACTGGPGAWMCPLGGAYACQSPDGVAPPTCSPDICVDTTANPPPVEDIEDAPFWDNDGALDANNECTANLLIFSGRAMRCRPPGALNTFMNCCKDQDKIIKDGSGSGVQSISTMYGVGKSLFTGVSAAYGAFQAGATAGAAAEAGLNAMIVGIDPTSIAISLAVSFMIETLLQGCDQQDMEVGMLKGSGMCHEVGRYCASSVLGVCVQHARGHCCYNTKLGRILQEQGRPQLRSFETVGWGTPSKPYCRGFTPEEFQALDFGKMDLAEYYADLESQAQSTIQVNIQEKVDAYMRAVEND